LGSFPELTGMEDWNGGGSVRIRGDMMIFVRVLKRNTPRNWISVTDSGIRKPSTYQSIHRLRRPAEHRPEL
jgi:hypothetical protein